MQASLSATNTNLSSALSQLTVVMDREDGDEEVLSNSSSFVEGRSSSVLVSIAQLSTDRQGYKHSKACTSCDTQFSSFGLSTAKKYVCRFCYTGVCNKCSPHRIIHPESKRKERCCAACYSKFVSDTIRADVEVDLTRRASEADVLLKRYEEERKAKEVDLATNSLLTSQLETLKQELTRVRLENETTLSKKQAVEQQLRSDLRSLQIERDQVNLQIQTVTAETELAISNRQSLRKNLKTDAGKVTELERMLRETEEDMKRITQELNTDQAPVSISEDPKSARIAELQRNIEADREALIRLQQDNITLTKQVSERRERGKEDSRRSAGFRHSRKEREMTHLEEGVRSSSDQLDIPELQRRIQQLSVELEHLRHAASKGEPVEVLELRTAVSQEKEKNKSLMLQFQESLLSERTADPVADTRCRCQLM